ncbi:MAG: efflux RND transporter permease subunit [Acidimicrobiales bacterium]
MLAGAVVTAGAIWLLIEDRDDDDFYAAETVALERPSNAIVSGDLDILTEMPSWLAELLADPVDARVQGVAEQSLFIGIAPTADVDRYLSGVAHHEVANVDLDGRSITDFDYLSREGSTSPGPPGAEQFWETWTEGASPQTIEWSLESGNWTVVIMNADGSAGVDAEVEFAARISNIGSIAWSSLAFGVISLIGGAYLVRRGSRRPPASTGRTNGASHHTTPPPDHDPADVSPLVSAEVERDKEKAMSDQQLAEPPVGRSSAFFGWVTAHTRWITVGIAVVTILAALVATGRSTEDPNFDPSGEIYDTLDLVSERFVNSSPIEGALFVVEATQGPDALTRDVLLEFKQNSDALRANAELTPDLAVQFRPELGEEVDGVFSIADKVDEALPSGLEGATDADVKVVLADILGDDAVGSPLRDSLAQSATSRVGEVGGQEVVVWEAPAFTATVVLDLTDLGGRDPDGNNDIGLDGEEFLRKVQTELQGDQRNYRTLGLAIDFGLASEEQLNESSPFILLAVVGIMILVGALLRSYWAAAIVAIGLAVTMLWYNAVLTIIGFEGGLLLGFIGPISVIAFGVDFFVHASGRAREQQVAGVSRDRSYQYGLTLVFPALFLAVISSAAAFISNGVAGIQAIVQFGIGTAIALLIGFVILGLIAPRWLLTVEDMVGNPPIERGLMIPYKFGFILMTLVAGAVVTFSVVMPVVGLVALAIFVPLFVYLPIRMTRRVYAKAAAQGRATGVVIKGAGHGFKAAGDVVHFLARWRVVTIPVTIALAVLGAVGFTQVKSAFTFSDFLSEDSDTIQSINLFEDHFGGTSGLGSGFIYVEGDLTQPETLAAVDNVDDELDAAEAASSSDYLTRDLNGDVTAADNAVSIVRAAMASPTATAAAGVDVTDADGDGLPDTAAEVKAIFDLALAQGITTDDGFVAYEADSVTELLWTDGAGAYATIVQVGFPTLTEDDLILDARAGLDDAASSLERSTAGQALTVVSVSGDTVTLQDSLAAFTDAMLLALPVALLLCAALAAWFMRSIKYGIAAVAPILLVVGWVYGFMYLVDYKINVVTATIAAIAVGVGIDYSTHFTMRFREEFENEPSRFPALRRAGEGTGGALAISALSSIIGFSVMALAPMPIFVTFGTLTAVMITFSLLVSLMVLPSVLLVVTRSRTGAERQHLLDLTGIAADEYDPHSRQTAIESQEVVHH